MRIKNLSLRTLLLIMLMVVVIVPMVMIAAFAIPSFSASLRAEASKALDTHAAVGREILATQERTRSTQLSNAALDVFSDASSMSPDVLQNQLRLQSDSLRFSYMLWADSKGQVVGSTGSSASRRLGWPLLASVAKSSADATTFVAIVPASQLAPLGIAKQLDVPIKAAAGGSAMPAEAEGAISLVTVAPVASANGKRAGVLVGVDTLKGTTAFVDAVASEVGGAATIFQNGVRVSTTLADQNGVRQIGTPVSDKVRAAVLVGGKPYDGTANVLGSTYIAAYEPLRDPSGTIVGMMFVGMPDKPYSDAVARFALNFLLVAALGLALAGALGVGAARTITRPIVAVDKAADKVAAGDLTIRVPEEGFRESVQLGAAFNAMTGALRDVLARVGVSAGSLETVSGEIADASRSEADTASSQASAVAEASASIEELTRSFGAVAEGAQRVLEIAEESLEAAESGREHVTEEAAAIDRLAGGTVQVRDAADELERVAEDIDQVTFVIGSIAEQTKILALNAAIEAARAGEAGKGFGVVSAEIRTLADSVSSSIGRISALVESIQKASHALTAIAAEQGNVATDTVMAGARTQQSLDGILEQMGRTAAAAREIAAAANQQQSAATQIAQVMQDVSQGVSGSAASSRQVAESAGHVKRESEALRQGLGRFRT